LGAPTAAAAAVDPDDPAAIVFTSGTTGSPKGACYTHASLLAVADIEARRHPEGLPRFQKHLAPGLSFAHVGTMTRIAVQIANLGSSLIYDTFDVRAILAAIERERLTHLGGIPTQLIALLDHPDRARRDLSSLRSVLVGGAPAAPSLIRRIQDELGAEVSVRYSSTEVGIATASVAGDSPEVVATTVGRATPGVELRIVDEGNHPLPVGATGEVVVRSPATMREYWRDPDEPPTLAELRAFVGDELASFKRPDGLTLLDDVPLTPMFKVDRRALRTLMEDAPSPAQV